jgi:group I intron endonuclease
MEKCYLYRHVRLDTNMPFYIGVGSGRRAGYIHGRNEIWNSIHKELKGNFKFDIILDDISIEYALQKEKEFISMYGRIDLKSGTLANMTAGGLGTSELSPISKTKIIISNTGKKRTEEVKLKMGLLRKGRTHTEESKNKISKSQLGEKNHMFGKVFSEIQIQAIRERVLESKNPNYKGKIIMLDKDTKAFIRIFSSLSECRDFLGLDSRNNLSMIYACISGKRKHYMGYSWAREM